MSATNSRGQFKNVPTICTPYRYTFSPGANATRVHPRQKAYHTFAIPTHVKTLEE